MAIELINPESSMPVGTIIASSLQIAPTGFLICDGSNTVSRTTYANLFGVIAPNKGTVTITIASPGVVTLNSHGFLTGESIFLTTTGALPTGLSANTLYFVISVDTNTFRLATSYANAIAGTPIDTSGSQSGTHTLFYCPYGLGSSTSNFKLPDLKNATVRGRGLANHPNYGNPLTTRLGYVEDDAVQSHSHNFYDSYFSALGGAAIGGYTFFGVNQNQYTNTEGPSGRVSSETRMKNQGVNFFIKF